VPILQIHHTSHHTSHVSNHNDTSYYRTTGTSPLMTLSTPAHSATALSNGSRPYDDLESEDDLDREDITFPSDAGIVVIYFASAYSAKKGIYKILPILFIFPSSMPIIPSYLTIFYPTLPIIVIFTPLFPFFDLNFTSFSFHLFFKTFSFSPSNLSLQILNTLSSFILSLLFFLFP